MSVSIITFADLGRKSSISSNGISQIIKEFDGRNELDQVICKTNRNFYFKKTFSAIPILVHYLIRVLEKVGIIHLAEKIFGFTYDRSAVEKIFDFRSSCILKRSDLVFFHGGHFLPRTLLRSKNLGSVAVDIPRMANLNTNSKLELEELEILELKDAETPYTKMSEMYQHLNSFDFIIAFSEFVKKSYVEHGFDKDRIYLAPQDVDLNRFTPSAQPINKKVFKVLYVGYTNPLKGLHYLLDAWSKLDLPNSELILIGGYGVMPKKLIDMYESKISKFNNVVRLPHVNQDELIKYYREASVLVLPSLTEGMSRAVLEAMACGIPVITTENAKGLVEDGVNGFVVPIRDPESIRQKIEILYKDRKLAENMGGAARKTLENKKPFGQMVYEIYQDILKNRLNEIRN